MRRTAGELTKVAAAVAAARSVPFDATEAAGRRVAGRAAAEASPEAPYCDSEAAEEPKTKAVRGGSMARCAVVGVEADSLAVEDRKVVAMRWRNNRGRSDVGGVRMASWWYLRAAAERRRDG
jgi:hypothetical protein